MRSQLQLLDERSRRTGFGAGVVDERSRKHDVEEAVIVQVVAMGNHAERGDEVLADRVLTQGAALRESAREPRRQQARFGEIADLMLAIEDGVVAPRERVLGVVAAQVFDYPGDLAVFVGKGAYGDVEGRITIDVELLAPEQWRVDLDQPARAIDDRARTTTILAELHVPLEGEVVHECEKDAWIGARPRVDRLLVVADREDVTMSAADVANHGVLHRIQVLELVDEDTIPARLNTRHDARIAEELCGL